VKILHFYKTYYPDSVGGVEQLIFQLASHSEEYGIEANVLSLSKDKMSQAIFLKEHCAYKAYEDFQIASTGFSLNAIPRFTKLAREADIVHYHFPWPFMDLVHFLTSVKKPTIISYHSDIVRQKFLYKLYKPLMNYFLKSVDAIVVSSPNYLQSSDVLQSFAAKVDVIPIGINKVLYPEPSIERLSQWERVVGKKFFLFVGVLRYYKGLTTLLDALALREFPVVIVGSGPMERELKSRAAALGLKNIIFLGYLSDEDKVALLKLSYAFIFPSKLRSEAFGISLLEAAMYGKPLISCEIATGTSYININNLTGFVVPPSDAELLHKAMVELWSNEQLAKRFGIAAEQRYQSIFTADKMVKNYYNLYLRVLHRFTAPSFK
jgi:rhamnosyl/mannosyltransferase